MQWWLNAYAHAHTLAITWGTYSMYYAGRKGLVSSHWQWQWQWQLTIGAIALPRINPSLKLPKCEIFDLFDFNDFYVIKSH
jgi:hypothetical protein